MDKEVRNVLNLVIYKLGQLNDAQIKELKKIIKKLDIKQFPDYKSDKTQDVLASVIANKLQKMSNSDSTIYKKKTENSQDPKLENSQQLITKRSAFETSTIPTDEIGNLELPLSEIQSPEMLIVSNVKKAYIVLDSRNRRLESTDWSKFSWYYGGSRVIQQGQVTSTLPFNNIIAMQLYQPIIPRGTGLLTSTQRISVLLEELDGYAYISDNRRYHWLFRYNNLYNSTRSLNLNLNEYNDGLFKFPTAVNLIGGITFSFGNPSDQVTFIRDRDTASTSAYGASTTIQTVNPHNLVNGDVVIITGFSTGFPEYFDNNIVNNLEGFVVTVVSPNHFTIPVDTSAIPVLLPITYNVFYNAFRFIAGIEFTYIDQ